MARRNAIRSTAPERLGSALPTSRLRDGDSAETGSSSESRGGVLRRRKTPPLLSLDEPVSAESPSLKRDVGKADPSLSGAVDRIALRRAIEELPTGCRQIFDLHEVQGYQHHEIARRLQCSIGNSKSQLHKAKMKMRDLLFPKTGARLSRSGASNAKVLARN